MAPYAAAIRPMIEAMTPDASHESDARPNILFISQLVPWPLTAGARVRAFGVLRHLAKWADVHLVCLSRADDPAQAFDVLAELCASVHAVPIKRSLVRDVRHLVAASFGGQPFTVLRDDLPAMRECIESVMRGHRIDAIHADQLWMAQYALRITGTPRVIDIHASVPRALAPLAHHGRSPVLRWLLSAEAGRLARYEAGILSGFDSAIFVNSVDRDAVLARINPESRSHLESRTRIIPIAHEPAKDTMDYPNSRDADRLLFVGGLHWPPNADGVMWFAREVLPIIRDAIPDVVLSVVGKRPPRALRKLARRPGSGIEVLGFVDDPAPLWTSAGASVVPLRAGGGMRVKILDAWAHGTPVVTTDIGAEGIDVRPGIDALVADEPREFAAAVVSILRSAELRDRIGRAGRARLEADYSPETLYARLDSVYSEILGRSSVFAGADEPGTVSVTGSAGVEV